MELKYLETKYSSEKRPKSSYPNKLINYLSKRFEIKKGMVLLEIGSGRGDFLQAFEDLGLSCSGIDIDPSAKIFTPNIDIQIIDITKDKFPYQDKTFDVVFQKSVIEHIYNPNHLLSESLRILKPGGKLLILTPDWESQMKVFYEDITHCRPYTVTTFNDAFKMINLGDITVEKFRQLPISWNNRFIDLMAKTLCLLYGVKFGRWLTKKTGIKFFRWSVELMVLACGTKPK